MQLHAQQSWDRLTGMTGQIPRQIISIQGEHRKGGDVRSLRTD